MTRQLVFAFVFLIALAASAAAQSDATTPVVASTPTITVTKNVIPNVPIIPGSLATVLSVQIVGSAETPVSGISFYVSGFTSDQRVFASVSLDGNPVNLIPGLPSPFLPSPVGNSPTVRVYNAGVSSGIFRIPRGVPVTVDIQVDVPAETAPGTLVYGGIIAIQTPGTVQLTGLPVMSTAVMVVAKADATKPFAWLFIRSAYNPLTVGMGTKVTLGALSFILVQGEATVSSVKPMILTVGGECGDGGQIQNIALWKGGVQIGTTQLVIGNDCKVWFDLSATPLTVVAGQPFQLQVTGDIVTPPNVVLPPPEVKRVAVMTVEGQDVSAKDTASGIPLLPTVVLAAK